MIVGGALKVPGDKSLTHRALLWAALAGGRSELEGVLTAHDARSTARVLRRLGAAISPLRTGARVVVQGRGRLLPPGEVLHCGNAGTTARLLLGVLAAHPFAATLTGDTSLRRRPMARVTDPLAAMGARFDVSRGGYLPITAHGGARADLRYRMPVSSAQIKSALLLAGAVAGVDVSVHEPEGRSRDHTERMLRATGFAVVEEEGWVHLTGGSGRFVPFDCTIPGDPSSAAFLVGLALLADGGELLLHGVGLNPTRTGFLDVLRRMGAAIDVTETDLRLGEPAGDLVVRPTRLRATRVEAREIPALIDEIPLLAVLAARADGTTVFEEVGELRVKESDRLGLLVRNLRALGVEARAGGNSLEVCGTDRPLRGRVETGGDHRIAMAFGVLGQTRAASVELTERDSTSISYPGFWDDLARVIHT